MSNRRWRKNLAIGALFVFVSVMGLVTASAESKARIVRLSEVQGSVQMDRGTGDGFDKTFLNMPVVEGSRVKTGSDGRAEVEFEDGSALRIVPNSEVDFTRLALGDDGQKLSTLQLTTGLAYVNYRGKGGDEFTLQFGHESVSLMAPAHLRIGLRSDESTLAVIKGQINVNGDTGPFEVDQKHTATIDLNSSKYDVAKNVDEISYDEWDKQQSDYHDRYAASGKSYGSSPYAYGMSDLNYYGNYMSVPGYGMVWQPYLLDAGWSPFQDGGWVFYPGVGYTFVSAYPWGWMPYRYGNWAFVPGYGWVWQPGYWNTYTTIPRSVNPPRRTANLLVPPTGHGTVMIGRGLTVNPPGGLGGRNLLIAPGSAGLGVPRGTVRNLDRVSREVTKNNRPMPVAVERPGRIAPPSHPSTGNLSSGNSYPSASASGPSQTSAPRTAPRMASGPSRVSKPH